MKKYITINITLDDEKACVTDFDIVEGVYNRVEFVADGIGDPMSVKEVVQAINEELTDYL